MASAFSSHVSLSMISVNSLVLMSSVSGTVICVNAMELVSSSVGHVLFFFFGEFALTTFVALHFRVFVLLGSLDLCEVGMLH